MYISTAPIQLTYADTDMMGVIYHGNYVKFLELGRSALIADAGFDYLEMEKQGYYAPVYNLEITYKKPIRFGDQVFVKTWVEENKRSKTVYGFEIVKRNDDGEHLCATGTTTHIVVNGTNFRPVPFNKAFPEWFQKYEEIKKQ
ncbi:thioesterase family protein [Fictibacillus enclensis]|jgi:acyl-CoA thioester hydrolase|uniref:acyl-CoA thioesterase n=1 Tax=Fictibacillus enclensis TaxID=1017270 RepID=UPI0025A00BF1|nr:thioesterase family protein [Fictibacillus enclensis]MDM5337515.1 thioesterase family protein [Fictibacillus enclensis]